MKTLLILIFALAFGPLAEAHAFLDHADPRVGSINKTSPHLVKIWFTEELEPAFSKVEVFDAAQREVDRRDVKIDPADKTVMTVSVPDLAPGTYRVIWHAVAVDTHRTQGSFSFTVKP
jgi:methionine-rich copper-binding protein CopC